MGLMHRRQYFQQHPSYDISPNELSIHPIHSTIDLRIKDLTRTYKSNASLTPQPSTNQPTQKERTPNHHTQNRTKQCAPR